MRPFSTGATCRRRNAASWCACFGDELRASKAALGRLVTIETGKILSEGLGEVQEMIDICDFAVGLSRQLYGLTIASERADHRMMETWHPLGVAGIISAFNFPVAVWAWNAALALVCGNACVWKPSEKTPLTALAPRRCSSGPWRASRSGESRRRACPRSSSAAARSGEALAGHPLVRSSRATGSTRDGPRGRATALAQRFARAILELGGNNARHRLPLGGSGSDFARRRFRRHGNGRPALHDAAAAFRAREHLRTLRAAPEAGLRLRKGRRSAAAETLVGPLIDGDAFAAMQNALEAAKAAGGAVTGGARARGRMPAAAFYARPALVEMPSQTGPVEKETFAPILYVMRYRDLSEAIACTTPYRKACRRRSSRTICARPSCSSRRAAPIAASPT